MPTRSRLAGLPVHVPLLIACVLTTACLIRATNVEIAEIERPAADVVIPTAVKAHLFNGDIVVYRNGATVTPTEIHGEGMRYDFRLQETTASTRVLLDSVVGLESFSVERDGGRTAAYSALPTLAGTALVAVGTVALLKAIFGSCPTVYVDSAGSEVLQGESFSYSIAPLYEARDVDGLTTAPGDGGRVWLRIRNEALETHYINHLELLQVEHDADERALPDERGVPLVIGAERNARAARDAAGRDLRTTLQATDGRSFSSDAALVRDPAQRDYQDHIDLVFDGVEGRDSVALVLRMRNSLLNTVLFYDVMLGSAGAAAVNWLGTDLETITNATETGLWYRARSGMRISVLENGTYRDITRIGDSGPIADKDVAVMLPSNGGDSIRVRLAFLPDLWRIDRVALADARRGTTRMIEPDVLTDVSATADTAALARVLSPDARYLVTYPGDWVRVGFPAVEARATEGTRYTYMLASQGYYTEWVRNDWLRNATAVRFQPGDAPLDAAYARWNTRRPDFEAQFYRNRVHRREP